MKIEKWVEKAWYVERRQGGKKSPSPHLPNLFKAAYVPENGDLVTIEFPTTASKGKVVGANPVYPAKFSKHYVQVDVTDNTEFETGQEYTAKGRALIDVMLRLGKKNRSTVLRNHMRGNGNVVTIKAVKVNLDGHITRYKIKTSDGWSVIHYGEIPNFLARLFSRAETEKVMSPEPVKELVTNEQVDLLILDHAPLFDDSKPVSDGILQMVDRVENPPVRSSQADKLYSALKVLLILADESNSLMIKHHGTVSKITRLDQLIVYANTRRQENIDALLKEENEFNEKLANIHDRRSALESIEI